MLRTRLEFADRIHRQARIPDGLRAAQVGQVDDGGGLGHVGPQALQQAGRRQHRAAGGDQVIDQQHALAGPHRIRVHLHRGIAVFQGVFLGHRAKRQLALLAHRHETQVQFVGQHRAHDEAARVDPRHQVQTLAHVAVDEQIDQHAERARILQHRGDVPELHTGFRPIGHGADRVADVLGRIGLHGGVLWREHEGGHSLTSPPSHRGAHSA